METDGPEATNRARQSAEPGNYHDAKRELLRLGLAEKRLSLRQIREALPPPHVSRAEFELFLFSLEALGIDLVAD
jgi:hypothetical protein